MEADESNAGEDLREDVEELEDECAFDANCLKELNESGEENADSSPNNTALSINSASSFLKNPRRRAMAM